MAEGKPDGAGLGAGGKPPSSKTVRQYADAVARGLINGRSVDDMVEEMVRQGWKKPDAKEFVSTIDRARRSAEQAAQRQPAVRRGLLMHLVLGVLWVTAGVTLMLTATPQRDLSSLGVAVIAFGVIEGVWAVRGWRR